MALFKSRGKHAKGNDEPASEPTEKSTEELAEATKAIEELVKSDEELAAAEAEQAAMDSLYSDEESDQPSIMPVQAFESAEPGAFVSADFDLPSKRKRKVGKVLGITFGSLAGLLLIAYLVGVAVFSDRFLPSTFIGDMDISMKTSAEAEAMLNDVTSSWKLDVTANAFNYRLDASTVHMSIDAQGIVEGVHSDLSPWAWPVLLVEGKHDEVDRFDVAYSQDDLALQLKGAVDAFNETAVPPTNATIEYSSASNAYVVKPEVLGTQLNYDVVLEAVKRGVDDLAASVQLGEEALLVPAIRTDDPKLQESAQLANGMVSASLTLNLGGQTVSTADHDVLSTFIAVDGESNVTFNEEVLNAWIADLVDRYDTIGTQRTYTRADGKQITVQGGSYGWDINRDDLKAAMIEAIKTASATTIDIPCYGTANVIAGAGNRDWGARYIDVDLSEQHVYFYDANGALIWESDCISGKPDGTHDTVPGVWVINDKKSPSKLIGYENGVKIYESDVTYWMPFEGNAIGLHDADWQPAFGGTRYADGYGSHGCVNLPPSKAQELYGMVEIGDVVSCHW